MIKKTYTPEFKEHALRCVLSRSGSTIKNIAADLNMMSSTLKGWMKEQRKAVSTPKTAAHFTADERLTALHQTFSLSPEALNAWCRERGLFASQLQQWRKDFIASSVEVSAQANAVELRKLKVLHANVERDLRRKDQALAETAALLVLQKKFQALFSDAAL
jgi:transposase-like protein